MKKISISYDKTADTFSATDEHDNRIVFKADREHVASGMASAGKSLSPMLGLLMAMGACSGIDVVMILKKQRQDIENLMIIVEGVRETDRTPALWESAHLHYVLSGRLDEVNVEKAVALSIDKYCSVAETLRRAGCAITYSISVG